MFMCREAFQYPVEYCSGELSDFEKFTITLIFLILENVSLPLNLMCSRASASYLYVFIYDGILSD